MASNVRYDAPSDPSVVGKEAIQTLSIYPCRRHTTTFKMKCGVCGSHWCHECNPNGKPCRCGE